MTQETTGFEVFERWLGEARGQASSPTLERWLERARAELGRMRDEAPTLRRQREAAQVLAACECAATVFAELRARVVGSCATPTRDPR